MTAWRLVAIVVDGVLDVFSSARDVQREVPVLDERYQKYGIGAAYRHDDRLVFLLDADRLVEPAMLLAGENVAFLASGAP